MTPDRIVEKKGIMEYLVKRGLLQQYQKAKRYLLDGNLLQVSFKQRQPKKDDIWYFRINKQFRALGVFDIHDNFVIFEIDNHQ